MIKSWVVIVFGKYRGFLRDKFIIYLYISLFFIREINEFEVGLNCLGGCGLKKVSLSGFVGSFLGRDYVL